MATVAAVTGGLFTTRAKTLVTAGTHYVSGITDWAKAVICIENNDTIATVVTLKAGTGFSAIGQGDYTAFTLGTVAATNGTVMVAGTSFESARYLNSNGYVQLLVATSTGVYVSAIQL
jgi:hypothetical protein